MQDASDAERGAPEARAVVAVDERAVGRVSRAGAASGDDGVHHGHDEFVRDAAGA